MLVTILLFLYAMSITTSGYSLRSIERAGVLRWVVLVSMACAGADVQNHIACVAYKKSHVKTWLFYALGCESVAERCRYILANSDGEYFADSFYGFPSDLRACCNKKAVAAYIGIRRAIGFSQCGFAFKHIH